jgi:predicted RNA binding protein with dsRBD fold (UPF0201 family)
MKEQKDDNKIPREIDDIFTNYHKKIKEENANFAQQIILSKETSTKASQTSFTRSLIMQTILKINHGQFKQGFLVTNCSYLSNLKYYAR